jgi:hypothetical protein
MDDKNLLKTFDYQPLSLKAPFPKGKVKTVIIRMCLRHHPTS